MDPDLAIVVDNASSDGSAERASPAGVRLIRNPDNRGFARAANQGIAATEAPMILLLNPDAEVVGGSLEALVKVARERPQALEPVGAFDQAYFMYVEDVALCTRLRRAGWQVLFSPELEVVHQIGVSTQGQHGRMAFEHSRSIYRYFSKYRARGAAVLLKPFVRLALWLRAVMMSGVAGRPR